LQHYHPDARVESLAESWSRTEGACRFLREQIESVTRYLTVLLDDHESVALLGLQLLGVADLLTQAVRELIVLERTEPVGDVVEDCDEKAEDLDEKADPGLLGGNQPEEASSVPQQGQEPPRDNHGANEGPTREDVEEGDSGTKQQRLKNDKLWSHITISRDQTKFSNFRKDLLLIMRSSRIQTEPESQDQERAQGSQAQSGAQLSKTSSPSTRLSSVSIRPRS